jgi:hypothetical protein
MQGRIYQQPVKTLMLHGIVVPVDAPSRSAAIQWRGVAVSHSTRILPAAVTSLSSACRIYRFKL